MADEQIRIDVTATDDASQVLEDVAEDAEKLERLTPELEVTADTDQAERAIKDLGDDADKLSRKDTEILLRAKIDDARGQLKALRTDLDQTGEKAEQTARQLDRVGGDDGGRMQTRGNAIADLTGPLGEASGAASDFAGVFDGLGDIAEDVAGKVGLNAAAMSTAIGGVGIAVAAAAALWTVFQSNQAKAKERQRELEAGQRAINDAIREGNYEAAAGQFQELYGPDVIRAAKLLGVSIGEVTDYVTGQSSALEDNVAALESQGDWAKTVAGIISNLRDTYADTNGTLDEQDAVIKAVTESFERNARTTDQSTRAQERAERQAARTQAAFDRIRGSLNMESAFLRFQDQMTTALTNAQTGAENTAEDILDIKNSILDVAEFAKLTPVQVQSLLEAVDRGDLLWVAGQVEAYYRNAPVGVSTQLQNPDNLSAWRNALQGFFNDNPVTQPVRVAAAGASGAWYGGPR